MSVSTDNIKLSIERMPPRQGHGGTFHEWEGRWPIPDGESEDAWNDALHQRVETDRIVEDEYDYRKHGISAQVHERTLVVTAVVTVSDGEQVEDEALDAEGRNLIGIVQGLIFDWED